MPVFPYFLNLIFKIVIRIIQYFRQTPNNGFSHFVSSSSFFIHNTCKSASHTRKKKVRYSHESMYQNHNANCQHLLSSLFSSDSSRFASHGKKSKAANRNDQEGIAWFLQSLFLFALLLYFIRYNILIYASDISIGNFGTHFASMWNRA